MRHRAPSVSRLLVPLLVLGVCCPRIPAQEVQRGEHDWCVLTVPAAARAGEGFDIKVEYRDLPDGTHLHCDLKAEDHSMMQWHPPRIVSGTGEASFRCTAERREGVQQVYALIYASTDGTWEGRIREAATPRMTLGASDVRPFRGRSWVAIEPGYPLVVREGEPCEVTVECYLDESEAVAGSHAFLQFVGLGPWNDEEKFHVFYPGLNASVRIGTGRERHTFRFAGPSPKAEDLSGVDGITPAAFIFSDEAQSWTSKFGIEKRGSFIAFRGAAKPLALATGRDGNLFTYDERVAVEATVRGAADAAELHYAVRDHTGEVVARGAAPLPGGGGEVTVRLEPDLKRHGIFLLEAEVPGLDKETLSFATVPDLPALMGDRPSRFGMCDLVTPGPQEQNERNCRIARKLGLSYSRTWVYWRDIEPTEGDLRWGPWDSMFAAARKEGIGVNALLFGVPAWAQRHPRGYHWQYDPPEWEAWRRFCAAVTERYAGRGLYSVEFWNEPVPNGWWHDSPEALARLHEVGNAAVKAAAPDVLTSMAGGVFPQSQYVALLAAGGGEHVDVVPIHYGNGETVELYRAGLRRFGLERPIWDNESGRLIAAFGKPRLEDITNLTQANWVPRRWTDELAHGCERIFYFSWMDSGGNWACFYPDGQPRTSVPVLAVYVSKMLSARYRGAFRAGERSTAHLFERDGRALLVLWSDQGEEVEVPVGARSVVLTDIFGNERVLEAAGGTARVLLAGYGSEHRGRAEPSGDVTYLEGADLDVLLALTVAELRPTEKAILQGTAEGLSVIVTNPYEAPLSGAVQVGVPEGWAAPRSVGFSLSAGETAELPYVVAVPLSATPGRHVLPVSVRLERPGLPPCERRLAANVITPEMVGNMVTNGGFEQLEDGRPVGWETDDLRRLLREEQLYGGQNRFLRLEAHGERYVHSAQAVQVTAGQKYLYSAWMRSREMGGGSNLYEVYADGHTRNLTNMSVFAFSGDPFWELYTKVYEAPPGIRTVSCVPVGGGEGYAEFDNVRLTVYEDTAYAAECLRLKGPLTIDGDLSDWTRECPIPLLGPSQLAKRREDYAWSPENLSGVAFLRWDDENLYIAAYVRDDRHVLPSEPDSGDGLALGFDPTFRGRDMQQEAFPLFVGESREGWHLLVRPKEFGGPGRKTGNLNRDGASTEVAVVRTGEATVYEVLVPFHYLGSLEPGFARKFGFSAGLIDNDGAGPAALMQWGEGLSGRFEAGRLGCVTFVR